MPKLLLSLLLAASCLSSVVVVVVVVVVVASAGPGRPKPSGLVGCKQRIFAKFGLNVATVHRSVDLFHSKFDQTHWGTPHIDV